MTDDLKNPERKQHWIFALDRLFHVMGTSMTGLIYLSSMLLQQQGPRVDVVLAKRLNAMAES